MWREEDATAVTVQITLVSSSIAYSGVQRRRWDGCYNANHFHVALQNFLQCGEKKTELLLQCKSRVSVVLQSLLQCAWKKTVPVHKSLSCCPSEFAAVWMEKNGTSSQITFMLSFRVCCSVDGKKRDQFTNHFHVVLQSLLQCGWKKNGTSSQITFMLSFRACCSVDGQKGTSSQITFMLSFRACCSVDGKKGTSSQITFMLSFRACCSVGRRRQDSCSSLRTHLVRPSELAAVSSPWVICLVYSVCRPSCLIQSYSCRACCSVWSKRQGTAAPVCRAARGTPETSSLCPQLSHK